MYKAHHIFSFLMSH